LRDFATSPKYKGHEFSIDGLIGTLDVEEEAREKDACGKRSGWGFERQLCSKEQFPQE